MTTESPSLGYLIPEFPGQTHIFFWREINAIRALGIDLKIISTQMGDVDTVKHDFAKPASLETLYLHPPKLSFFLKVLLSPLWFFRCLQYIASLDAPFAQKIKLIYFIVMAAGVLCVCEGNNIKHIHGHSCASVAHILAMAGLSGRLTYSLTLHGGLNIYGDSHRQKMQNAAFVATVTKPLKEEVNQKAGVPHDKIPVISMGVDLKKFSPEKRSFQNDQPLRFVTVARLALGKGHIYSLKALKRMKEKGFDFLFTIVGDGPDQEKIQQDVITLGLQEQVKLTGTLSENEVLEVLENSDVLLLTSFGEFEAAPVCVMEAMASGIPTVTSIIGGTRDMVDHEVNGFLVEQHNIDEIESSISKFFNDRSLLETMGEKARLKAEQCFSYRQQASALIDKIKETTGNLV